MQLDVEIYTDVDGILLLIQEFTEKAKLLKEITYDEMLEMASTGAKVLMARSVEFGRRYNVPIIVKPTFNEGLGTIVKENVMEQAIVSGVTHNDKEIKFTLFGSTRPTRNCWNCLWPPLGKRKLMLI